MQATQAATKQDMILKVVFDHVYGKTTGHFVTAEYLVIGAWKAHPKAFGLKGYADLYPDSNLVLSYLMGKRGLVTQGFLERVAPKTYRLTEKGRERAEGLP